MAEKPVTPEEPEVTTAPDMREKSMYHWHPHKKGWMIGGLVGGFIVLAIIGGLAFAVVRRVAFDRGFVRGDVAQDFDDRGGMMGGRGGMRGGYYATNGQSYVMKSGVVTAVSSDGFTLAGNGTTVKIITDDSTTYQGASSPVKVNDTVRISTNGAQSDGSYKALTVYIGRQ